MPEPWAGPASPLARGLHFRKKIVVVSGDRRELQGALTMIRKLLASAEMGQDLKSVPESGSCFGNTIG